MYLMQYLICTLKVQSFLSSFCIKKSEKVRFDISCESSARPGDSHEMLRPYFLRIIIIKYS